MEQDRTTLEDKYEALKKWEFLSRELYESEDTMGSCCEYCFANDMECEYCSMGPNHKAVCNSSKLTSTQVGMARIATKEAIGHIATIITAIEKDIEEELERLNSKGKITQRKNKEFRTVETPEFPTQGGTPCIR